MATSIYLGNPPENIKQFIIENYGPKEDPMLKVPLHFVAEEPNAVMSFNANAGTYETSPTGEEGSWTSYNSGDTITLVNVNDKVYFRAGSDEGNTTCVETIPSKFIINTKKIGAYGNIQSLLDRKMEKIELPNQCYYNLFQDCSTLTHAPILPATTIGNYCYCEMFYGCSSLTQAPELPATLLGTSCYEAMFRGCSNLLEPKFKMNNLTVDQVANAIKTNDILGDAFPAMDNYDIPVQIKCSDKTVLVEFDLDNFEWTLTEC